MTLGLGPPLRAHVLLAIDRTMRKAPAVMRVRRQERFHSLGRICIGALLAFALVAAALLSVAPGLHKILHPDTTATHLCVVTLFASGHCESTSAAPISAAPDALPLLATFLLPDASSLPRIRLFSLLEHAPPSFA